MKKISLYSWVCMLGVCCWACSDDEPSGQSIFDTSEAERNEFDKWILQNYVYPYNIECKYRLEDIETDMAYHLAPPEIEKAQKLAKIVKFLWLEAYDEVAGIDFTRSYVPKQIMFVGSPAYNDDNTMVLGTAEGGLKVVLYNVNNLVVNGAFLNHYYFKTIHHEFGHILHQTKNYDPDFQKISEGHYIGGDWKYASDHEAHQLGFVTPYAQSEPNEDFVENIAMYVTNTPEYWEALLEDAGDARPIIEEKFTIVKNYMLNTWKIDLDVLRDIVQRRSSELNEIDLDTL